MIYLAFSSGLSGTYNGARLTVEELKSKYPGRKILVVDTLAASMGEGLLVYHAAQLQKQGAAIEEVAKWVEENRNRMAHWFTAVSYTHLDVYKRQPWYSVQLSPISAVSPITTPIPWSMNSPLPMVAPG